MIVLEKIAQGGEFDAVVAVRVLATELLLLQAALNEGQPAPPASDLAVVLGNTRLAAVLAKAGLATTDAVRAATDEQLLAIAGVTEKGLGQIREKLAE